MRRQAVFVLTPGSKCNSNFSPIFFPTRKLKFWICTCYKWSFFLNLVFFFFLFDSVTVLMSCFIVSPLLPTRHTPARAVMKTMDVLKKGGVIVNPPCVHMISAPREREVAINWNNSCFEVDQEKNVTKTHTGFGGPPFFF